MNNFSFTVAIPTYNRPQLLRRALLSIEKQTLHATEVIVSDNATPGIEVDIVIKEFTLRIPNLRYIKHSQNVGAEENFFGCLSVSTSEYFMFLADDDEFSPDCFMEMIKMFNREDNLVTAVPIWHLYTDDQNYKIMPARSYNSPYWILRAAKFMYKATDESFYGLHKRNILRMCTLKTYAWPNKKETLNLVYPVLLEMLIFGKIIVTDNESAFWNNYDFGIKYHEESHTKEKIISSTGRIKKIINIFKYIARIINLQIIYLSKVLSRGGYLAVFILSFVSIFCIFKEIIEILRIKIISELKNNN